MHWQRLIGQESHWPMNIFSGAEVADCLRLPPCFAWRSLPFVTCLFTLLHVFCFGSCLVSSLVLSLVVFLMCHDYLHLFCVGQLISLYLFFVLVRSIVQCLSTWCYRAISVLCLVPVWFTFWIGLPASEKICSTTFTSVTTRSTLYVDFTYCYLHTKLGLFKNTLTTESLFYKK